LILFALFVGTHHLETQFRKTILSDWNMLLEACAMRIGRLVECRTLLRTGNSPVDQYRATRF
jgi:hypothetical protein